jgi:hypothetical protein
VNDLTIYDCKIERFLTTACPIPRAQSPIKLAKINFIFKILKLKFNNYRLSLLTMN